MAVEQMIIPKSEINRLKEENEALKIRVVESEQVITNNSQSQQELLELLIDMEVI